MILADEAEDEDGNGLRQEAAASTPNNTNKRNANREVEANLVKLQHRHEGVLWNLDRADSFHAPLAFLLLLQQFAFPRHVTAIALGENVLAHRGDRFAGDDLAADRGLDGHLVQLARDDRLQLLDQLAALYRGFASVRDQ